jgi:superfamily II DNA or RNA helicase
MKKTLRPYQQDLLDEILQNKAQKLCVQLSTGGGKTVIFTELISQLNKKTLILVDSIDLVNQTVDTFKKQGLDTGCVLAGSKEIPQNQIIVAMVQSLWNRKSKLPDFELCIIDECHVAIFDKMIPYLKEARIIGFTATPVRLGRYKINDNQTAQKTLSDVYDDIVCGKPISWLMENGYLINEQNVFFEFDGSTLKTDSSGEYTAKSMETTFQAESYQKSLKLTYNKYCENKKTMIFTSSCLTNLIYQELFKDKNTKVYDSKTDGENREDIVEWFKNTPDAILINTGCFTKGFDVCDVECIIMARATKSLSLWIQIAGRGARPTLKTDKPYFLLVDGGNNNEEHQIFSFDRDWNRIFFDKKIKDIVENIQECNFCGFTFLEDEKICPNCGEEVPEKPEGEERKIKEFELRSFNSELPIPTFNLDFHINKGSTKYQALQSVKDGWIHFLKSKNIPKDTFIYHKNRQFKDKFIIHLRPIYFKILGSILKDGKHVKYETFISQIYNESFKAKYGNN